MCVVTVTPQEIAALQAFATDHGRRWKSILLETYWYNARLWRDCDGNTEQGSILHGLRNRLGPAWLAGFRLP